MHLHVAAFAVAANAARAANQPAVRMLSYVFDNNVELVLVLVARGLNKHAGGIMTNLLKYATTGRGESF
jgi:hypothetical protein